MTSMPAQRLGLTDRGLLRDGYAADVVVFDLDRVAAPASFEQPREFAVGMEHVLVAGQPVIGYGRLTGATPGRALHGPASAGSAHAVPDRPARPDIASATPVEPLVQAE
jgi:N-acyl-D-aspartate/D-glutamate deacylase